MKTRHRQILPAAVAALAAAVLCGCRPLASLHAWVASDMVNLTSETEPVGDPAVFDASEGRVNLFAAANETVSFQVVLDARRLPVSSLSVQCGDLSARRGEKIDAVNVSVFRAQPVRITHYPPWYLRLVDAVPQAVDFYDALVPIAAAGALADVPAGGRAVFWVDLHVPRDTKPGRYTGRLKIASLLSGESTFTIALEVYDFVLPDARPIATVGGFASTSLYRAFVTRGGKPYLPARMNRKDPLVRKGLVVMRQLMRLGHRHRLDLFDKSIRPLVKRDMSGRVRMDWDDYDAIVTPYLDGSAFDDRIGCPAWPMPVSDTWPQPIYYGGPDSDTYAGAVGTILGECRKHFDRVLSRPRQVFFWPYRGPVNQAGYERHARLARIARSVDTETPILSRLPAKPPSLTGWRVPDDFAGLADMHAAPAQFFDPAAAAAKPGADHPLAGTWLTPGTVPYLPSLGVIATPGDVRAIPWFAMKYKCAGLFLPEVLHWEKGVAAFAETRLFYAGPQFGVDAVLPSIRLKRLRRGLQDIAYLWLLRQHKRAGAADTVLHAMTRYAGLAAAGDNYLDPRLDGWVQDEETWRMARRLLAEEVRAAVRGEPDTPNHQPPAQRVAWRRFEQRAHRIRVEQVRSRVVRMGKAERLRVFVLLDLYNEYTRAVEVTVRLRELPPGWKLRFLKPPTRQELSSGEAWISHLAPGARVSMELAAECNYVPATEIGKLDLPVTITTDVIRHEEIRAPVPFIMAGQTDKKIIIDGDLDDWPMRLGNSAGGFRLVGRRGRRGNGRAKRQTVVLVLRDRKNLYIGFRCTEPDMSGLVARPSNIIHYEQLMACGEDLVEIILDPGARAKGPEDLYHLIVKPNGVLLAERGIHTDPPLGKASPWPVGARLAVAKRPKMWTVEMAIPISSMPGAENERFWGVNFTRFATRGAEASSWSGAPRYFYDPRNLGTMFFGAVEKRKGS